MTILLMSLVSSAVLASCGGDAERVSDEEFAAEAARIATAVLLTEDDLPDGWRGTPPEDDDEDEVELSDAELEGVAKECRDWIQLFQDSEDGNVLPVPAVDLNSDTFGDDTETEISSTVGIFRNLDALEDALDMVLDLADRCGEGVNALFTGLFAAQLKNDPESAALVDNLEVDYEIDVVPGLGDQALRLTGSMSFETLGVPFDLETSATAIRVGRVLVSIEATAIAGLDGDLVDELTNVLIDRARSASEELPD
jgi:hypothetical protein